MDASLTVAELRKTFGSGRTKPFAWRRRQLDGIRRLLLERGAELERALAADLTKNPTEAQVTEIGIVLGEVDHALKRLRRWLRPKRVDVPVVLAPATARVIREPLGVVLIIGPWNYPVQLALVPLIGALAAGNTVALKPSELAPETSSALARLLPEYVDRDAVRVIEGDAETATALLAERFDHIFFTGNAAVGRIVARAAAEHLTPVTLELGGKSPAYVDDGAELREVAHRIAWGAFMNAGQTCVRPDYVLAKPSTAAVLIAHLRDAIEAMYGPDPRASADYGRLIHERHHQRLVEMLAETTDRSGEVVIGGDFDAPTRYFAPTVVDGASRVGGLMDEEIFGPILPIVHVRGADDAITYIRSKEKPLALYVFSDDERVRRRFLRETSSGAVGFDVTSAHLGVPALPFGGVGQSGAGRYHGEASLETFSNPKAIFGKPLRPDSLSLVYPPFTAARDAVARVIARTRPVTHLFDARRR